jgi:hypothetical protein
VAGGWRILYKEGLYQLYAATNIIRVIKSRRVLWAGHVAHMGEMRNAYRIFIGKPKGQKPL